MGGNILSEFLVSLGFTIDRSSEQAAINSANLNLDYARVRAPFDGVVGVRLVDPGNIIHATDTTGIVILTQVDPIAVFMTLPQDDFAHAHSASPMQTGQAWIGASMRFIGQSPPAPAARPPGRSRWPRGGCHRSPRRARRAGR